MICNIRFPRLALFLFFFALFSVSLLFADCSVSSLTTSAVSAAQVGYSVTVTVTYSTSGCAGQQLYLDTSSGLVADPAYRTLGSDSGSETFSISAAVAGTYSYNARLSTSTSTTATIEFASPSVLTVDPSSSPSSVSNQPLNSAFTLRIIINNPSGANIVTTYSLSYDSSAMSISGDSTSGSITVNAGESTTLTWSVTPTTYFPSGKTISFNLGSNSGAFTTTVKTVSETISSESKKTTTTVTNVTTTTPTTPPPTTPPSNITPPANVTIPSKPTANITAPPEQPIQPSEEQNKAYAEISALQKKISKMKDEGYDVSSIQKKLTNALDAYNKGDYSSALTYAKEASAAAGKLSKPITVTPTQPPVQPPSDYTWLMLIIVVVIVVVFAIYYLSRGRGKGYKFKGHGSY